MPSPVSLSNPRYDRKPPVPPLCQVMVDPSCVVVNHAQPMRSSSKSARGSVASAPGAVPSHTARSQSDRSWVVERIDPAGADPFIVHGAAGSPDAVNP